MWGNGAVEGSPRKSFSKSDNSTHNNPSVSAAHCQAQRKARPPAALKGSLLYLRPLHSNLTQRRKTGIIK